jgi:hypothetical protein
MKLRAAQQCGSGSGEQDISLTTGLFPEDIEEVLSHGAVKKKSP